MGKTIRLPGFAGNYYSKQKGILEREVAVLLENAHPVNIPGKVLGIVAPSDKQIISGGVAARAYGQLVDQDIDYVVIISPANHTYFEEISIYNGDAYSTPLGDVAIAKDLVQELVDSHLDGFLTISESTNDKKNKRMRQKKQAEESKTKYIYKAKKQNK